VIRARGRLPAGTGLHARPAADLVEAIVASGRPVRVGRPDGASVDGRSVLRVLGLGIHGGDEVELSLDADDDDTAAASLLTGLLALLHCDGDGDGGTLKGIGAAPGTAVGPVARMAPRPALPDDGQAAADPDAGEAAVMAALDRVAADLRARAQAAGATASAVLEAGAGIAEDRSLREDAVRLARAGRPPAHALGEAFAPFRAAIAATGGALAARAADVDDVRDRAIAACLGLPVPGLPEPGHPYVLVADDVAPADAAMIDPSEVVAIVTSQGGPTGHTAILARELGIPAVVACPGAATLAEGDEVAVLGSDGLVVVAPDGERRAALAAAGRRRYATLEGGGATADGHPVALYANLGAPARAAAARAAGAEGVGLLRTEFCFDGRTAAPDVAEQVAAYGEVARAFAGMRVVIRLLDAGADKPLPYVRAAAEQNPALGIRGLRALRAAPDLLRDQLDAIARVARTGDAEVWAMAPMVATAEEAAWFAEAARAAGIATAGVMIEIPAAALAARQVLAPVDFASIGTNDLAQYAFAADRGVPELAHLQDPHQPALLRLVEAAGIAARELGRPLGVCGEAAGDESLAPILVGLGAGSLSMAAGSIAAVRERLAEVTLDECRRLAAEALS
jgi:phosphotransferase system enzyme I (PtsI)